MRHLLNRTRTVRPGEGFTLDLGSQLRELAREWRLLLRRDTLAADLAAGTTVALVALPLSLAIANASGVSPGTGLVTAIVGGIVAALLGGCRFQVSGPTATMTFLVYEVLTRYGPAALVTTTLMTGLLLLGAGWFRLGRIIQFIPRPVVAGLLSGIGLTILCSQLPVVLGYDVTHEEEGGAFGLVWETLRQWSRTEPRSLIVGVTAFGLMLAIPRIHRRLPAPLLAVGFASLVPILFGWTGEQVKLLGALPRSFPAPTIPAIPWEIWNELFQASLTFFILSSIESLLSASVVDSMVKETKVDNDQELVGQGLANMASALFGGIPVSGVIVRSSTNIQAGARTRLAAVFHALILLASMLLLAPIVSRIPLAALAGVLMAVSMRMVDVRLLRALWRAARGEALVFLVTVTAILATDLIDGVQVGLLATVLYFVSQMSQLNLRTVPVEVEASGQERGTHTCPRVLVVDVDGPLFFASRYHLRNMLSRLGDYRCLVLDLRGVSFLDVSAATVLENEADRLRRRGMTLMLARACPAVRSRLESLGASEFRTLSTCPIYDTVEEALTAADRLIQSQVDGPCAACAPQGCCQAVRRVLNEGPIQDEEPVQEPAGV